MILMMIKERISQTKQKIEKLKGQRNILTKVQIFKFQPFSRKQKQILTWWVPDSPVKDYDGIIADGAIRSGKTVCMSLSFVMWAMSTFSGQNFAMCGKTIGSFRRNVLFWLKLMLKSRGYRVVDHRADNMVEISRGQVTNYFYIFGGKDERSQDLIQGITLAGLFCDEVALMPESFVNQARDKGRQKTDAEFSADLKKWLGNIEIRAVILDPAAASFKAQLEKDGFKVKKAKNDVLDGIRLVATLLLTGSIFIDKSCENLIKEFASYIWDAKAADKGEDKPVKEHDHALDALRYFCMTIIKMRPGIRILK